MNKKSEWFRIGEVSEMFHISVGLLHHYDKIGLLKPEYTDPETGYRYYSVRQFECLNTLRYLRALDIPLEEISGFLKNRNLDTIHDLLRNQKEVVRKRRQELLRIEHKIDRRLAQIDNALSSIFDEISLSHKPCFRFTSIRTEISPRSYLDLESSIRKLDQTRESSVIFLGKVGIGISGDNLLKHQFQPYDTVFLILDEEDQFEGETSLFPESDCVSVRFQGSHEKASIYYERLMDYIEEHHLVISGFSREITMIDDGFTNDPSKFVTEIEIPVTG